MNTQCTRWETMSERLEGTMHIGSGVEMLRAQYLAGIKKDKIASFPTFPRPNHGSPSPFTMKGTIKEFGAKYPELEKCLWNNAKICSCGKICAYTMIACNSCGKGLPDTIIKSENVFMAFLFGIESAGRGFPYTISCRRETDDVLVIDDILQLCICHLNGIPKRSFIPDFRFLLNHPEDALQLLNRMEEELWEATKPFLTNTAFRETFYKRGITYEGIKNGIIKCFNFPPSQYQLHLQWLVPPLTPFQHHMTECENHFQKGRAIPMSYVRKILALKKPTLVRTGTSLKDIIEHYKGLGVDYDTEWTEFYNEICLGSTLSMQNWDADDFKYVVQGGNAHDFRVHEGRIEIGNVVIDANPIAIQDSDRMILQSYGRPYDMDGKPTGTYIERPLEPKWGEGGLSKWPSDDIIVHKATQTSPRVRMNGDAFPDLA